MAENDYAKKRKRSTEDGSSSSSDSDLDNSACRSEPAEGEQKRMAELLLTRPKTRSFLTSGSKGFNKPSSSSGLAVGRAMRCHKEVTRGARRRLWDVDSEQVDLSIDRELRRMHRENTLKKAVIWNFDFEKEIPLSGNWEWSKTESAPKFYKTKRYPPSMNIDEEPSLPRSGPVCPPTPTKNRRGMVKTKPLYATASTTTIFNSRDSVSTATITTIQRAHSSPISSTERVISSTSIRKEIPTKATRGSLLKGSCLPLSKKTPPKSKNLRPRKSSRLEKMKSHRLKRLQ